MSTTLEQSAFAPPTGADSRMGHLDWLEAESIHILRELVAECSKPALLFSGGKDSVVVLHLALKAFGLGANRKTTLPFPLVHIDTGHNSEEVIDFRDRRAQELGAEQNLADVKKRFLSNFVALFGYAAVKDGLDRMHQDEVSAPFEMVATLECLNR